MSASRRVLRFLKRIRLGVTLGLLTWASWTGMLVANGQLRLPNVTPNGMSAPQVEMPLPTSVPHCHCPPVLEAAADPDSTDGGARSAASVPLGARYARADRAVIVAVSTRAGRSDGSEGMP